MKNFKAMLSVSDVIIGKTSIDQK